MTSQYFKKFDSDKSNKFSTIILAEKGIVGKNRFYLMEKLYLQKKKILRTTNKV